MGSIALSSDSTCDIGDALKDQFDIHFMPYTIISEGTPYKDNVDIRPMDLFKRYWDNGSLPQTSAINVQEYVDYFENLLEQYDEVIHLTLGGAITSSAANAAAAAEGNPRVHVVDSQTLSTGMGLLLIKAGEMIASGASAEEAATEMARLRECSHASFILDTLEFMRAGGRCSAVSAVAASMLNIKPCIVVDNRSGSMSVSKKYRGKLQSVIRKYVNDQLDQYDEIITDHIFVTHTDIDQQCVDIAREVLEERLHPEHIHDTTASCTISCHCGPATLGVLFLTEAPKP